MVSVTIDGRDRFEAPEKVGALAGDNPDTAYSGEIVLGKRSCADRSVGSRLVGIVHYFDRIGSVTCLIITGIGVPMSQGTAGKIDIGRTGLSLFY